MINNSFTAVSSPSGSGKSASSYEKQAWLMIWVWVIFLALVLLLRGGRLLVPVYPVGSLVLGLFLYFRVPALYVGYTWWYCFLGSLVRRIIDFQSGTITPGRWGLVGMLVASISFITLFRYLPATYRRSGLPFVLSAIAVIYSFTLGLLLGRRDLAYIVGLFEWLGPIAFSFHLFIHWQDYPRYRQVIERSFNWGILVIGLYGIYQFCILPEWDRFYMNAINAASFGAASPFKVRVFGTLGSPQSFATVVMAGLLLLFGSQGNLRFLTSGVGYLSFLLSMARSAWVGWITGVITFFPFLKPRFQARFIVTVLVMAILVVPLVSMEPFSEGIQQRIESFSTGQADVSFQGRSEGYSAALGLAFMQVTGWGLGTAGPATALGGADSGILPLFFSFGWVGVIPYGGGLLILLITLLQSKGGKQDIFSNAAQSIVLGTLAQIWLNNIFLDAFGLVLWGFLGISLAAQKYYTNQQLLLQQEMIRG